jgi:large subunit ribosomal protein L1
MKSHGKKYSASREKVEVKKYSIDDAVSLLKEIAPAKFDETVDAAFNLGIDTKQSDQTVRGTVKLPHGLGKKVTLAVITKGEKLKEALDAGADFVGTDDIIAKIEGGWLDFDYLLATPDVMGMIGKLGKILGRRGLMPSPKTGTVTFELAKAVSEFKAGKIDFKADKFGNVHLPLGKVSFPREKIKENFLAVLDIINKSKPSSSKGIYMKSVTISSTMGPGIRLEIPQ